MLTKVHFLGLTLLGFAALGAQACSSKSSDGGGTAPAPAPTVTQHITAAAGGTVADAAGTASLSIPGGALSKDLDITLATTAAESGTASSVYNFGPEGTQFATPATLVLKMPSGVSTPSGATPTLATYDGTKWAAITGSTFANGSVTGPVAHFSKFAIIFVNGQAVVSNSCSDTVTSFTACGGDITGTWNLTDYCAAPGAIGGDPTDGGCPGFLLTADITPSGSITFNSDGSYSQTAVTTSEAFSQTAPTSCLGGKACDSSIFAVSNATNIACSTTGADCVCTGDQSSTSAAKSGTYTATANAVSTDGDTAAPYCVKGTTLYVQQNDSSSKLQFVIVATKQ